MQVHKFCKEGKREGNWAFCIWFNFKFHVSIFEPRTSVSFLLQPRTNVLRGHQNRRFLPPPPYQDDIVYGRPLTAETETPTFCSFFNQLQHSYAILLQSCPVIG